MCHVDCAGCYVTDVSEEAGASNIVLFKGWYSRKLIFFHTNFDIATRKQGKYLHL